MVLVRAANRIAGLPTPPHFFLGKKRRENKHKKQHVHRTAIQPTLRRKHPVVDYGRRVAGFIHRCGEHRDPHRALFIYLFIFFSLSIIFPTFFSPARESFFFFFLLLLLLSLSRATKRAKRARIFARKEEEEREEGE